MLVRIKLEVDNVFESDDKKSVLDMIVKKNMTIGSLQNELDMSPEAIDRVMVNGIRRSEYYSLDPRDCITFETEKNNREENNNEGEDLKSEAD